MNGCECISEDHMVTLLKAHKDCAYSRLLNLYREKIYHLALSILHNEDEAKDVTQDVMLKVYEKVDGLRTIKAFSSWLYMITKNLSLARTREKHFGKILFENSPDFYQGPFLYIEGREDFDPEEIILSKEKEEFLQKAMIEMPSDFRRVLILKIFGGLSLREISRSLDLTVPAVKSRLHRGREYLKKRISKEAHLV